MKSGVTIVKDMSYSVRPLADLLKNGEELTDVMEDVDALVAAYPSYIHPGNDMGDDEKWVRLMHELSAYVYCLIHRGKKIVGYWSCFPVTQDAFDRGIVGDNINKTIDIEDIDEFMLPREYNIYFVDFFVYKHHRNMLANAMLYRSFSGFLKLAAKQGYFVKNMFAHASSYDSIRLCSNAGFSYIVDHKSHVMEDRQGNVIPTKIYNLNFDHAELSKIFSLDRELIELYRGKNRILTQYSVCDAFPNEDTAAIIESGEGPFSEFKSTLRVNLITNKVDESIQLAVLKTIAAFLNNNGGTLLIGVSDDGEAIGLEADNFPNEDKMGLHLTNLVRDRMGPIFLPYILPQFEYHGGKRVLTVRCRKGPRAAFVKDNQSQRFFVRSGNSTSELLGSAVTDYVAHTFR